MSTVETVVSSLQSAIDLANGTTGASDTNVTDAIKTLISGYGGGGSETGSIQSGSITPTERLASFSFNCPNANFFTITTYDDPDLKTGKALLVSLSAIKSGMVRAVASINSGGTINIGSSYSKQQANYPTVSFTATGVTLSFSSLTDTCRTLQPNLKYDWAAW